MEVWKSVPGASDYEISSEGRLRSYRSHGPHKRTVPKILKSKRSKRLDSYHNHSFFDDSGVRVTKNVHLIVAETFLGSRPSDDHQACHNDGDRDNNRLSNIEWKTRLENAADQIKHGTQVRGSKSAKSKLTEAQVAEIKRMTDRKVADITAKFGISRSTVNSIRSGRTWGHVK